MAHPELHRHLDGSLRPATLAALAAARGLSVPADLPFSPGMGLEAALSRFAFTLSTLQEADAVRRVAAECAEDAFAEGVAPFELRFLEAALDWTASAFHVAVNAVEASARPCLRTPTASKLTTDFLKRLRALRRLRP